MAVSVQGYLQQPYLTLPYLSGQVQNGHGVQVFMNSSAIDLNSVQVLMNSFKNDGNSIQVLMSSKSENVSGVQALMSIIAFERSGVQVFMNVDDRADANGVQALMRVDNGSFGQPVQVKQGKLAHWTCESYLNRPYLETSYLAACMRAFQGVQVSFRVNEQKTIGVQVKAQVNDANSSGIQTRMQVFTSDARGIQVKRVRASRTSAQVTMVIYNITQLRILQDFASRGVASLGGLNWTSIQPIEPGDFSEANINTDVLEQRCQTAGYTTNWELRCDTGIPQGAYVDTIAILEHNFTRSARVTVQGSSNPLFSTVGFQTVMVTETLNMYWISPTLPTEAFRYWRFIIQDATNPFGSLYVGSILFGASRMFTVKETFDNPARYGLVHYKDSTSMTEGFTSVSNDRSLRKNLGLSFSGLRYDGGNYKLMKEYFENARTDLKCLVIPRPERPGALAVFAKMARLPDEEHNATSNEDHFVSFSLDWDESL